jgi:hypothetical protein
MSRKQRLCKILLEEIRIRKTLNENSSKDGVCDQIIRTIFNYQFLPDNHSGRAMSDYQKSYNPAISLEAKKILETSKTFADFHKKTINEHQFPVANIFEWTWDNCSSIEWKDIEDKISTYPMVTITLEEDEKLRKTKNVTGDPKIRYEEGNIKVMLLKKIPKDYF